MEIFANDMHYQNLNQMIRDSKESYVIIKECIGQRYIGNGTSDKTIKINGTPGNALGAYLNGSKIIVNGNAQDATGDTMNEGTIIINGNSGDATGYAMRGGKILIQGNAGYRAGIHMKQYKDKKPVIVIGGTAGCFLGEYLAGGVIIVLGLNSEGTCPVGSFCATGMHGGKIFIRSNTPPENLPAQVVMREATSEDLSEIEAYIDEYAQAFSMNAEEIKNHKYYCLVPNSKNPYKQLYTVH